MRGATRRAGGVLLEVVLALAILVVVGSFTLATASDATRATFVASQRAEAIDLAASLLAEYRMGLRSLRDVGEASPLEADDARGERFDVRVERSESSHPGFALLEVRVAASGDDDGLGIELASLVCLVVDPEASP